MRATTKPLPGLIMSVLLAIMGWYMLANSTGGMAFYFGWFFVAIGLVAGGGNLFLLILGKRAQLKDHR